MKEIKTMAQWASEGTMPEILYWVGCAGSFDARAIRISKTISALLDKAGVSFGILGQEENCCGDPARRAGNEFVFTMLAIQNIEIMKQYGIRKIVTSCPHGYHTIKNEYPALGGNFEVYHHVQFLHLLMTEGRLKIPKAETPQKEILGYHDSCYLGRVNGEYEAPRNLLAATKSKIVEVPRNKSNGFCCGAGGAQMFKEEEKGNERINTNRVKEFLDQGCRTITANCPFCVTMLEDGLKDHNKEEDVKVMDIAEYLSSQLEA